MFICHSQHGVFILLLYVDDMVITGNDANHINWLITKLGQEFSIKGLRFLHHFLGIKVHHCQHFLFLCQQKYAEEILSRAFMKLCKPISTPMPEKGRHLSVTMEL